MVRPGITGELAADLSDEALASALRKALTDDDPAARRERCRAVATTEYPLELQARRYLDLYTELLDAVAPERAAAAGASAGMEP